MDSEFDEVFTCFGIKPHNDLAADIADFCPKGYINVNPFFQVFDKDDPVVAFNHMFAVGDCMRTPNSVSKFAYLIYEQVSILVQNMKVVKKH